MGCLRDKKSGLYRKVAVAERWLLVAVSTAYSLGYCRDCQSLQYFLLLNSGNDTIFIYFKE